MSPFNKPLPCIRLNLMLGLVLSAVFASSLLTLDNCVGCNVYEGVTLMGLSLFWWGAALFALLLVLHIKKPELYNRVSFWAVLADLPLLVWQLLFAPCPLCLIIAACLVVNLSLACDASGRKKELFTLMVATLLVLSGLIETFKVQQEPWAVNQERVSRAGTHLFFSPSCASCVDSLNALDRRGVLRADNAPALIPVALNSQDVVFFMRVQDDLDAGKSFSAAMLEKHKVKQTVPTTQWFSLRYFHMYTRLMWNKAMLLRAGGSSLPFQVDRTSASVLPEIPFPGKMGKGVNGTCDRLQEGCSLL